jgi:hypothetical protein
MNLTRTGWKLLLQTIKIGLFGFRNRTLRFVGLTIVRGVTGLRRGVSLPTKLRLDEEDA